MVKKAYSVVIGVAAVLIVGELSPAAADAKNKRAV